MNDAAFISQLIKLYDPELRRVLYRRCGCLETAADLVQETYQRMLAGNLWRQAENPRALLHRIAANLATDYERRNWVRLRYAELAKLQNQEMNCAESLNPERIIASRQRLDELVEAIDRLPPKCRTVFVLRKFEDLSHAEIAKQLGITRNMVERHLRHALRTLQQIDTG
ncbi:MAG: RNA polymerase sigma factor [Methylococcales bacterium]